jgi:hypothetical protein
MRRRLEKLESEAVLRRRFRVYWDDPETGEREFIADCGGTGEDDFDEGKMGAELLRFNGGVKRDPAIERWMKEHRGELGEIARHWFAAMRECGDEVRELLHDGCPVACFGDAPFGYVNVYTAHVNVGFFQGWALKDPVRLLEGTGKFMRHVKLRPGMEANARALGGLIEQAYWDMKERVENGA